MRPRFRRPVLARAAVLLLAALVWLPALARAPADDGADTDLPSLRERVRAKGSNPERLRQDLQAFRRAHPGTPEAAEAARLLAELPSPLDRLNAKSVPAAERFEWQPKELVAVLGEGRGRHGGQVQCVLCSPDGKTVVSGGTGLTRLWDAATLRPRAVLPYRDGAVLALALARDGRTLAVGGSTGLAQVWDLANPAKPALRLQAKVAAQPVQAVALRPDGKRLAAGGRDGALRLFDVGGDEAKAVAVLRAHRGGVSSLAWSPDGKTVASGGPDGVVRLWADEAGAAQSPKALQSGGNNVQALAYTPDGRTLAAGDANGNVWLWPQPPPAVPRPKARGVIWGKGGPIYALSFSNTGNTVATVSADGITRLWTMDGNWVYERARIEGPGKVFGVAYAPDNRALFTGGDDWMVHAWDLAGKPKERFLPSGHTKHLHALAFAPDGKTLATGSADRTTRLWDLTRPAPRQRQLLKGDLAPVHSLAYAPDGRTLAAGVETGTVWQWDAASGRETTALKGHLAPVTAVAYLPDGRQLLSAAGKTVFLWEASSGEKLRRLRGHETTLTCLALSPDGRLALSGSGAAETENDRPVVRDGKPVYTDCVLRLWDVRQGKEVYLDRSHPSPLTVLGFAADGREFFSGCREPRLRRWGLGEGAPAERAGLEGSAYYPQRLLVAPDGRRLVTLGLDGRLIVWDLASGARLKEWTIPEYVGGLALAPDGRHLAVGLGSGVAYVLRLAEPPPAAKK